MPEPETKLTGELVNYYLAQIDHPQREEQAPYQAECEDIIQALEMTFDEGCIFKAIWRSAAARKGTGKPGHKAIYDAEKIVHYGQRNLKRLQRASVEPKKEVTTDFWVPWSGKYPHNVPYGVTHVRFRDGTEHKAHGLSFVWSHASLPSDIIAYKVLPTHAHKRQ